MVSRTSVCQKNPSRSQPWIAALLDDYTTKYMVVCEQKEFTIVSSLEAALYVALSLYYCFNLEYPEKAKWLYFFFQDVILEQPDRSAKTATYLSVTSDIKRMVLSSQTN